MKTILEYSERRKRDMTKEERLRVLSFIFTVYWLKKGEQNG